MCRRLIPTLPPSKIGNTIALFRSSAKGLSESYAVLTPQYQYDGWISNKENRATYIPTTLIASVQALTAASEQYIFADSANSRREL